MVNKKVLELVKRYCKEFIDKDKPELILLTGSHNVISKPDDFDLCVVGKYNKKDLKIYSDFREITKYPKEFHKQEFEIEYLNWTLIKRDLKRFSFHNWHLRNATIIYDKNGKFKDLKKKLTFSKEEYKSKIFELFEVAYDNLENAKKAAKRKYKTTQKILHYNSFNAMIDLIYLINKELIPSDKWKIYLLKDINYKPINLTETKLANLSLNDLARLFDSIEEVILKKKLLKKFEINLIKG